MPGEVMAKHKCALIAAALLLVSVSVLTTLYATGVPLAFWASEPDEEPLTFQHATLSDAQAACLARARAVFGQRIRALEVDTFSSRLDQAEPLYKVFMEAEIYFGDLRLGEPRETFINCFVTIDTADVELFQYARDDGPFVAPGDENRGLFGL